MRLGPSRFKSHAECLFSQISEEKCGRRRGMLMVETPFVSPSRSLLGRRGVYTHWSLSRCVCAGERATLSKPSTHTHTCAALWDPPGSKLSPHLPRAALVLRAHRPETKTLRPAGNKKKTPAVWCSTVTQKRLFRAWRRANKFPHSHVNFYTGVSQLLLNRFTTSRNEGK